MARAEEDVLSVEDAEAAGKRQGALCGQLRALQVDLEDLVRFFGEDPNNCKPQDVLKIIGGTAHGVWHTVCFQIIGNLETMHD